MRRFLGIMLGIAALSLPVGASAPPRHTTVDFFVYDSAIPESLVGATVTVSYDGGVAVGVTTSPHGRVRFRLPGIYDSVLVTAEAVSHCAVVLEVALNGRSFVGGHGIFIGLTPEPCLAEP